MEEILASIKRIIAEDGEGAPSGARRPRAKPNGIADRSASSPAEAESDDEVLELTQRLDEIEAPAAPSRAEPANDRPREQEEAPELPKVDTLQTSGSAEEEPVPTDTVDSPTEEPLVSPAVRQASRQAIAALSAMVVRPDPPGADTLEGLVRDMLKPMLKEWLDARLPDLVEQVVAREIARIVAERG